ASDGDHARLSVRRHARLCAAHGHQLRVLRHSRKAHRLDRYPRQRARSVGRLHDSFRIHRSPQAPPLDRHGGHARKSLGMKSLDEYLKLAAVVHGHLCAGQVLGVRMAMLGLRELGIEDPIAERKRIVTYIEIDRCLTDAVALVANCRLGKRALKFRDWGKVAATFVDLQTGKAVRVAAKESSKQIARDMFPEMPKDAGQQKAYAQLADDVLFDKQ